MPGLAVDMLKVIIAAQTTPVMHKLLKSAHLTPQAVVQTWARLKRCF